MSIVLIDCLPFFAGDDWEDARELLSIALGEYGANIKVVVSGHEEPIESEALAVAVAELAND
jgi:hypothetical protein